MWQARGLNAQHLTIVIMALVTSLAVGVGIPLMQGGPIVPREESVFVRETTTATSTATSVVPQPSPVPAVAMDGSYPVARAGQVSEPTTSSSTAQSSPSANPDPLLAADLPDPPVQVVALPVERATSAATLAATPLSTVTASAIDSATPTASATPTPSLTSTAIPSVTPLATASPLPAVTSSRPIVLPPSDTPTQRATIAATAPPLRIAPPALQEPPQDARLRGVAQFKWSPVGLLPPGAYYELVVWSPEQDPNQAWGVMPPTASYLQWLNLDELFQSGRFREGSLYWTVLVVEQNPYRRLTLPAESERRYLVLATGG